jgi:hypothetical protein
LSFLSETGVRLVAHHSLRRPRHRAAQVSEPALAQIS